MCQIAYIKEGFAMDPKLIPQIMVHNQDGVGFMWQTKKHVAITKSFMTVSQVSEMTKKLSDRHITHAIHWRKATVGNINELNIHPFKIMKEKHSGLEIYGMLNGTLNQIKINNDDDCDARLLMNDILSPILHRKPDMIRSPEFVRLLEQAIGNARILMMTPREVVLVNESKGHWDNGIWYSNKYSNNPVKKIKEWSNSNNYQSGRVWDATTGRYIDNRPYHQSNAQNCFVGY